MLICKKLPPTPLGDLGVKIRSTKVMRRINNIGNGQQQGVQFWMASCLAMTKCVPCKDVLLFTHSLIHYY